MAGFYPFYRVSSTLMSCVLKQALARGTGTRPAGNKEYPLCVFKSFVIFG